MADAFIRCENLVKIYKVGDLEVFALQGLDLTVEQGELMAIIGASGSGKTTLLNILGGLDQPTGGRAEVAGWNLSRLTAAQRGRYRLRTVGFVWQNVARNLVPYLSAEDNVVLPMLLAGRVQRTWARELLDAVGLGRRMHHRPLEMSGGEQQRVAIAVALANRPAVLLADEPTGSLDTATGRQILEVFERVRGELGVTVVVVTHDLEMARSVDRFVRIRDGKPATEGTSRTRRRDEELALLDSAGRLQLPPDYVSRLGLQRQMVVERDGDRIILRPPHDEGGARPE